MTGKALIKCLIELYWSQKRQTKKKKVEAIVPAYDFHALQIMRKIACVRITHFLLKKFINCWIGTVPPN